MMQQDLGWAHAMLELSCWGLCDGDLGSLLDLLSSELLFSEWLFSELVSSRLPASGSLSLSEELGAVSERSAVGYLLALWYCMQDSKVLLESV